MATTGGKRMNDRLKFRMYDTNVNKMYMPNDYGGVESIYECLKQQINWDLDVDYDIKFNHLEDGRFFMQSTGLKDKNDKLIYEGDVLGGIYHGYIEYCDECKCFQLKVKDYGCLACEGDLHWYELVEAEEQNELEVIGNIYENKELLESEG